jgi:hypothetical protein
VAYSETPGLAPEADSPAEDSAAFENSATHYLCALPRSGPYSRPGVPVPDERLVVNDFGGETVLEVLCLARKVKMMECSLLGHADQLSEQHDPGREMLQSNVKGRFVPQKVLAGYEPEVICDRTAARFEYGEYNVPLGTEARK